MRCLKILILSSVSILLMGIGCNKEAPVIKHELNSEAKAYMCFKEGTYWDYIDTATGEERSVDVISDSLYYEDIKIHREVVRKHETFQWATINAVYTASQINSDSGDHDKVTFRVDKRERSLGSSMTTVFIYPFNNKLSVQPHGSTQVKIYAQFDTLRVLNKSYKDVVAFRDIKNYTEGKRETITYIAKHYGIIRTDIHIPREIKDDGTIIPAYWKRFLLTNFKIVQ